jgi:serine/threonine protein kinase
VTDAVSEHGGETTRLGSFEIVRKLARGGMAEIFLARTRGPSGFEKLVVLKKILPKFAGKPRLVQQFLDEAKLAASLDHPNIAQVYDIGMVDGSYFFTMEYLHGQDVRSILHRTWRTGGRFPIEHAVQIARHVAAALHFAHEKQGGDGTLLGIVHRDVSPSNIIVTYDGATKLLDFGVAKTTASTVKTRTGALKGKISYMSPEQARGAPIDRRSDIFSLGIVLWEMVTTQRLYRGENDFATLQLIITQPAKPPTTVRPECPVELERIVMRALADEPGKRYATADQLVTELDELAREHKLKQSPNALAGTMSQLFSAELAAWREAGPAGVPPSDPLDEASDMTTPVSERDFIELVALEDDDEGDDPDDRLGVHDNEKTEHAAPLIDPVGDPPPSGPAGGGSAPHDAAALAEPTGDNPALSSTTIGGPTIAEVAAVIEPTGESRRLAATTVGGPTIRESSPLMDAVADHPRFSRTAMGGLTIREAAPFSDTPLPLVPEPVIPEEPDTPTVLSPPVTGPNLPIAPPAVVPAPPIPPFAPGGTAAPAPGLPATAMPGTSPPLPAAPWQSGRPPPEFLAAPVVHSWTVVDLPPFDPEAFERRRRMVLRVAGGLIGFIFLLAILAGRC